MNSSSFTLSPRCPPPLHYKARKYGEATEKVKDNKELCGDNGRREQLAWVDGGKGQS